MSSNDLSKLITAFSSLTEESLNGDPMSFKGKIVVPLDDDKILKIMTTYDAIGEQQILNLAKEANIDFFIDNEILYQGLITITAQPKLVQIKEPNINYQDIITLNKWCSGTIPNELIISKLVEKDYGQDGWQKIKNFTTKYNIGNIYWRNIGFDKQGKIHCFDFFCGCARNNKGEYYV